MLIFCYVYVCVCVTHSVTLLRIQYYLHVCPRGNHLCVCVRVACALTQLSNAMQCFRTGDFPVRRSLSFAIGSARRALINCLTVFADEANEIAFHTRIYTNGQHEYDHDHGDDAEQRQNGLPSLRVEVG